ncbi:hypothetical protein GN956_G1567 [Arapaima gigas]
MSALYGGWTLSQLLYGPSTLDSPVLEPTGRGGLTRGEEGGHDWEDCWRTEESSGRGQTGQRALNALLGLPGSLVMAPSFSNLVD